MEQWITFNDVLILLTTGESLHEVQNWPDREPEVIISVCRGHLRVLKGAEWLRADHAQQAVSSGESMPMNPGEPTDNSGECADGLCGEPAYNSGGPGLPATLVSSSDSGECYGPSGEPGDNQ